MNQDKLIIAVIGSITIDSSPGRAFDRGVGVGASEAAKEVLRAINKALEGYVIVPEEPTKAMIHAGSKERLEYKAGRFAPMITVGTYKAMIAAHNESSE